MKYRVLGGRWGEGYAVGDIINIDLDAARIRLQLGELEIVGEVPAPNPEVAPVQTVANPDITIEGVDNTPISPVVEVAPVVENTGADAPWCDSCDSRGVRHKKECPKFVPRAAPTEEDAI